MATIKEVAQLAGVSIGTVSNVLNGKTNNLDLIERVESAMKELDYRPDANARSLKMEKSSLIGLILPNSTNPEYSSLIFHVETMLNERGYSVLLLFTHNNRLLERKAIDKCLEQRVDGIILLTVIPRKKDLVDGQVETPIIVVSPREDAILKGDAIFLDYSKAFEQTMNYFNRHAKKNTAMILDGSFLYNEKIIEIYNKYHAGKGLLKITDYSKERGFKAAYELLFQNPQIDAIVAGTYLIAQGVEKAIKLLKRKGIHIAVLKDKNWIEDEENFPVQIRLSQKKVAHHAVMRALHAIENPRTHEPMAERIFAEIRETLPVTAELKKAPLPVRIRLAMYDSPTSFSLKMLSEVYVQKTGIHIEFDLLKYDELEDIVYQLHSDQSNRYDGIMMDITWIDELVKNKVLMPLTNSAINFNEFIDGLEQQCGYYDGEYHAVPIMSGTQLLFYQKDLFENEQLKRQFSRIYGKELSVPETWADFNIIAEFFTRSFNPKSPIPYGVSKVTGENIYTTICYLNRLWSYGSDVFDDDGNVIIHNSNALAALKNFVNIYKQNTDRPVHSWDEVVEVFKEGKTAMAILYDSYAMDLNDYTKSKVAGNLGVGQIPGGTPVLGGWSIGINQYSTKKEAMEDFLTWVCSDQLVIPLVLLGGSTLKKSYYESSELEDTYPWKDSVLESYRKSRKRILPNIKIANKGQNYLYSHVISRQITKALEQQIDEEEALLTIQNELSQLINLNTKKS
ncbi:extracellular solute-binding protein [Neobacillus notoginsengisoli]|uniref:extracellular solute-binding protein n=1 Tax=Neobacillus notoginsengisoli TaxID=1578198 RepID=UPI001314F2A6|nr:extracellular solute-binding protein [Neobacillus notoginsengisoli]